MSLGKSICYACGHECHCNGKGFFADDRCDKGFCVCTSCDHGEILTLKQGENMIKRIWKKIKCWIFFWK